MSRQVSSSRSRILSRNPFHDARNGRRNPPSSPIYNLPSDLLIDIFVECLGVAVYDHKRPAEVIAISHVCRGWRAIALGTPILWTQIDLRFPRIAREFCIRSGMAPIRVVFFQEHLSGRRVTTLQVPQWLSSHAHRVETIYVAADQTIIKKILQHIGTAFPDLLDLVIRLDAGYTYASTVLVECQAPRLRRLCLEGVSMADWDRAPNRQPSLTNLTLSRLSPSRRPSVPQLLSALQRCPHLQTIIISAALSQDLGATGIGFRPSLIAELPRLQSFQIREPSSTTVAYMLSHLSIPTSCSLFLHCHGMKDLSLILPPDLSRLRPFAIDYGRGVSVPQLLQIFRSHITIINDPSTRLSNVEFAIVPDHLPAVLSNAIHIRHVLSNITILEITVAHHSIPIMQIPAHAWSTLLSCLPMLSILKLGGPWSRNVLSALAHSEGGGRSASRSSHISGSLPCPHLQTMQIADKLFQNREETSHLVNSLGRCLTARARLFRTHLSLLEIEVLGETTRAALSEKLAELRRLVVTVKTQEYPLPNLSADFGFWNDAQLRYSFQPPPSRTP
ncbi:hypothetical protein CERSUDRAFT_112161 [Gelatoporia subvermispora B]|uniref:F-box domain-containing protein n=1 Tax=Ceriporiopsis subvermispora (strain B) TaxID=914234 RepID=M2QS40_CERS8|nr:hypothetical protein CERSUDRAFT_112161 [Gelatoporia subvermispora B]